MAAGFSGIALVITGFRGSPDFPDLGLSIYSIVLLYFVLGLIAGAVLGVLRPFTRTKSGGFFVGWLIGSLAYGGAGLMIKGVGLGMIPVALILGLAIGGTLGYQTVRDNKSKRHAA
jgi:CHASE2 domain-containing sensor protein